MHNSSATSDDRIVRCRSRIVSLALLNHDLGGFDHRGHLVALLEAHFFGAPLGDNGFYDIVADLHRDERGNSPENYFRDFAFQMVASAECHKTFSSLGIISNRTTRVRTGCARSESLRCGTWDDPLPPPGSLRRWSRRRVRGLGCVRSVIRASGIA